jgi:hypothetical protein
MNVRRRPVATPPPTPAPGAGSDLFPRSGATDIVFENNTFTPGPLGKAMEIVRAKLSAIDQFGRDVIELIANNPKDKKYDLSSKEGEKACDDVRKVARQKRLAIKSAWDEGKVVLRSLNDDLKVAAEKDMGILQAIEDNAKTQLEAKAAKETERKAAHEKNIKAITDMAEGLAELSSADIEKRQQALAAILVDNSYEEFEAQARRKQSEVHAAIEEAFRAALEREKAAEAQRAKEALEAGAKEKIRAIKELPDGLVDTGSANIREILRIHSVAIPTAAEYGNLLEFAEMAHDLTTHKLQAMLESVEAHENAAAHVVRGIPEESESHPDNHGPLSNIPGDEPPIDDGVDGLAMFADPPENPQWTPEQLAEIASKDGDALEFNRMPAEPARVPTPRAAPPARGWRTAAPAATPAPTPRPTPAPFDDEQPGSPDLLERSRDAVTMFFANYPDDDGSVASTLYASMQRLKDAVDFISEFAD